MTTYTIEPGTVEGAELLPRMRTFLRANGIDPTTVPLTTPVEVTRRHITVHHLDLDTDGNPVVVAGEIATSPVVYPRTAKVAAP